MRSLIGDLPGQLAEGGVAGGVDAAVVVDPVAVEQGVRRIGGGQQPVGGVLAVFGDAVGRDVLVEPVEAGGPVDGVVAVGGQAELLAVLGLLRGVHRFAGDVEGGVVAVVARLPVPDAVSGDRGQGRGPEVVLDDGRDAAGELVGLDVAVDVRQAVIGVGAGDLVVPAGRQGGVLLVGRLQGRADPT
jgi:hypothetical protein